MHASPDLVNASRASVALNAVCPYFTMFPVGVPLAYLGSRPRAGWVLDPFCGRGTTNYAARLLGMPSVGTDGNPVAVAIAAAKLAHTTPEEVVEVCSELLKCDADELPEGDFWRLCFHTRTLTELVTLRKALLQDCATPSKLVLRAIVMGSLHGPRNKGLPSYFSSQMPRTYSSKPAYAVRFWEKRAMQPPEVGVLDLVRRKAHYYLRDVPAAVEGFFRLADSRNFDFTEVGPQFAYVVTSPPYYGMRTYIPDQWLRNWFVGGPSHVVYQPTNQMTHGSPEDFAAQLGRVWDGVARACLPGASFLVRFGGIHDRAAAPREIFERSISKARCALRINKVTSAGDSLRGKRQADQFRRPLKKPIEELDFEMTLES